MNAMDAKISVVQFKPLPLLDKALDSNLLTHLAMMKQAGQYDVTLLFFQKCLYAKEHQLIMGMMSNFMV